MAIGQFLSDSIFQLNPRGDFASPPSSLPGCLCSHLGGMGVSLPGRASSQGPVCAQSKGSSSSTMRWIPKRKSYWPGPSYRAVKALSPALVTCCNNWTNHRHAGTPIANTEFYSTGVPEEKPLVGIGGPTAHLNGWVVHERQNQVQAGSSNTALSSGFNQGGDVPGFSLQQCWGISDYKKVYLSLSAIGPAVACALR